MIIGLLVIVIAAMIVKILILIGIRRITILLIVIISKRTTMAIQIINTNIYIYSDSSSTRAFLVPKDSSNS